MGDTRGASGETGWLQAGGAGSEAAGENDCVHEEIIPSVMGVSDLSSAFTEEETLHRQKV